MAAAIRRNVVYRSSADTPCSRDRRTPRSSSPMWVARGRRRDLLSSERVHHPIHRRKRAVLHLDRYRAGSRCRKSINLFFSIGTDWPPLAQPARSMTHNTATWDLRSGRRASYRMPFEHRRWQSIVHIQTSLTDMRERVVHVCSSVNCLPRDSSSTLSVATLHHPIYRRVLTSSYATVGVGPPPWLQSERPLPTAFQFPCPNPTAATVDAIKQDT